MNVKLRDVDEGYCPHLPFMSNQPKHSSAGATPTKQKNVLKSEN